MQTPDRQHCWREVREVCPHLAYGVQAPTLHLTLEMGEGAFQVEKLYTPSQEAMQRHHVYRNSIAVNGI